MGVSEQVLYWILNGRDIVRNESCGRVLKSATFKLEFRSKSNLPIFRFLCRLRLELVFCLISDHTFNSFPCLFLRGLHATDRCHDRIPSANCISHNQVPLFQS